MELNEALYTTRAMRRLARTPVSDETMAALFDAAIRAPSGGNEQRFRFVVVKDPAVKAAIGPLYRESFAELTTTKYAAKLATPSEGTRRANASANHFAERVEEAPALIFAFGKAGGESSTFPAIWSLCLAARAAGLGTHITTLLRYRKAEVEAALGLPGDSEWEMHAMIPIGYPLGRWGLATRDPAQRSVFADRWGEPVPWSVDEPLWTPAPS